MTSLRKALTKTCPECKGDGFIQNEVWAEYEVFVLAHVLFDEPGISFVEAWEKLSDLRPDGEPEEVGCPTCEGTGRVVNTAGSLLRKAADKVVEATDL